MIFFIRHGESEANAKGVFAGQRDDSPLTEKGKLGALAAGEDAVNRSLKIGKIITSPLIRAKETAYIISDTIGYDRNKIVVDERIQEFDMGELSGSPKRHIRPIDYISAEDAEDIEAFQKRVMDAVKEIQTFEGNILLVSHSGVGRIIDATQRNVPIKEFFSLPAYANNKITELTLKGL